MGQQSKMFINEECVNKMWCIHPMMYLVSQSCPSLCDPRTVTTGLLCPWGFSRQEYWSRLSCPPPGEFPNPGIKPRSPTLQVDCLPSESSEKAHNNICWHNTFFWLCTWEVISSPIRDQTQALAVKAQNPNH